MIHTARCPHFTSSCVLPGTNTGRPRPTNEKSEKNNIASTQRVLFAILQHHNTTPQPTTQHRNDDECGDWRGRIACLSVLCLFSCCLRVCSFFFHLFVVGFREPRERVRSRLWRASQPPLRVPHNARHIISTSKENNNNIVTPPTPPQQQIPTHVSRKQATDLGRAIAVTRPTSSSGPNPPARCACQIEVIALCAAKYICNTSVHLSLYMHIAHI